MYGFKLPNSFQTIYTPIPDQFISDLIYNGDHTSPLKDDVVVWHLQS
jgi:hypothetical protein